MKALDTPALLALLEGNPRVRQLLKRWRGEEVATTEVNLLELAFVASRGSSRARSHRIAALGRLRRRITVLPVDSRAGDEVLRRLERAGPIPPPTVLAMLATLETNGCEELLTDDPRQIPGKWRFRTTKFT
ncbi:MAG TPA: PIN domain-containing protein [Thermoplasmata archaeon]|nr:PIN domain-containing protein [Thermoplasmata archaeon]